MNDDSLPQRHRPAHHPPLSRDNRSVLIFVTVCTQDRRPILCSAETHEVLRRVWVRANTWLVGRYILMPDHLHLFCTPRSVEHPPLDKWIAFWKSSAAASWPSLDIEKVWQRDYWDTQVRRGESYTEKWEYVRMNPVRKGLVRESDCWPYQGEMNQLVWHDET